MTTTVTSVTPPAEPIAPVVTPVAEAPAVTPVVETVVTPVVEPEKAPVVATPEAAAPVVPAVSVVPETYDLKLPAGSTLDPAVVERTAAIARELGLSNEAGQTLLDRQAEDLAARETALQAERDAFVEAWKNGGEEFVKRDTQWRADALADTEIGGTPEKLAGHVEKAQLALTKYGPELKTYLDETGLGSHPAAIKFLARIGKAMSEGGLVQGNASQPRPKSDAQLLYSSHYDEDGRPKT